MSEQILAEEHSLLLPSAPDLIWSTIIFVIIVVVLLKLMPKFTKILDERAEKIEGGIKKAEHAQEEAEKALAEYNDLMSGARSEAAQVREQAREEGAAIIAEARARAQAEADRIAESATRSIEAERQQAISSLRSDVGELATELASRIVGEAMTDEARKSRVVERFLDELENTNTPADMFQEK